MARVGRHRSGGRGRQIADELNCQVVQFGRQIVEPLPADLE
jgi:hypothetical protein